MKITYEQFLKAKQTILDFESQISSDFLDIKKAEENMILLQEVIENINSLLARFDLNGSVKNLVSARLFNVLKNNSEKLGLTQDDNGVIKIKDLNNIKFDVFEKCRNVGKSTEKELLKILIELEERIQKEKRSN